VRIFLFDLEMGGLDPAVHGLTEVSAAKVHVPSDGRDPHIEAFFQSFVRPRPELRYEDRALEIQAGHLEPWKLSEGELITSADAMFGFLETHGRDEPTVLRALKRWSNHYFGPDHWAVSPWSHNIACDLTFLQAAVDRCFPDYRSTLNPMMPCNRAGRCSMILFRCLHDLGVHACHKADLDTILTHYRISIDPNHRHTAFGDVQATAQAIAEMLRDLRRKCGPAVAGCETGAARALPDSKPNYGLMPDETHASLPSPLATTPTLYSEVTG